jgi:hypothetical protein
MSFGSINVMVIGKVLDIYDDSDTKVEYVNSVIPNPVLEVNEGHDT